MEYHLHIYKQKKSGFIMQAFKIILKDIILAMLKQNKNVSSNFHGKKIFSYCYINGVKVM